MSDEELQLEQFQASELHDDSNENEDLQDSEAERKVRALDSHSEPTRSDETPLMV